MKITNILVGILRLLQKKKIRMSIKEQMEYLDRFPNPSDDFERVFFQYKATTVDTSRFSQILFNIVANCFIPFFIAYYIWNKYQFQEKFDDKSAVVVWYPNKSGKEYDYSDIIPRNNLMEEFGSVYSLKINTYFERMKGIWGKEAFSIWMKLFLRYPFYGYMNLLCLIQVMWINKIIKTHNPKIILEARREETYTSTLITHFCETLDKEYAVFMHGLIWADKIFSFVRFSRIYVWHQYFIKDFVKVKAKANRFYVYLPDIFLSKYNGTKSVNGLVDFTYYFSGYESMPKVGENPNEILTKIIESLMRLQKSGNTLRVRPHPRWSDNNKIIEGFSGTGIEIENIRETTIADSLDHSKCVIATFSTVLLQAYYREIPIVIDDVTDPTGFREMNDADGFLLHLPHRLLSELN